MLGINNLDDILTQVPDIDIVWLGGLDARISMNLPGNYGLGVGDEPEWIAARAKFFEVMDKHDKPYAGIALATPPFGSPEAFRAASQRMSLIAMSADTLHLMAMGQDLQKCRELVKDSFTAASASAVAPVVNSPGTNENELDVEPVKVF